MHNRNTQRKEDGGQNEKDENFQTVKMYKTRDSVILEKTNQHLH